MHPLLQSFQHIFRQNHLLQPGHHFIAAVSGGIDSVVLCELLHQANIPFAIAHCNFGLRGEESERDEAFVKSLSEKYSVQLFVNRFNTKEFATLNKLSIQEAARELRYNWFTALKKENGAKHFLLAHHANDNIETVLMHFFRGTGLHGLTGIPAFSPSGGFRPLLSFTRKEIENFAAENKLNWVEDSSNASSKYTRNFFRNELLPLVQKVYPQAEQNILDNISRLQQTEKLYTPQVEKLKKGILKSDGGLKIGVKQLMSFKDSSLVYEVIKDFGFTEKQVPELIKLAESESGRYIENDAYRIIRHRAWFIVTEKKAATNQIVVIDEPEGIVKIGAGLLTLEKKNIDHFQLNKSGLVAQLDAKEVQFPLIIRKWKAGDYFYPLGMRKKKKLARFFIDQKLSLAEKENVWVVETHKRICWIVGHRIDDRFKITLTTKQVLQINLSSL